MRRRPAPLTLAALAVGAAALGFTYYRLYLGLDLQDESFYVVMPFRWAMGARPFVDEQNPAQMAALLEYPFVKLYTLVSGGSAAGLMLFTHHLYFVYVVAVAAAVLAAARRLVRWELAVPVAAVFVTFVLLELTQLSYNSMGAWFLTLGAALGTCALFPRRERDRAGEREASERGTGGDPETADERASARRERDDADRKTTSAPGARTSWRWAAAGGVAHGLAVTAFPTLLVTVPAYAVCLGLAARLAARRRGRRHPLTLTLAYLAGVAVVLAPVVLIVLSFGWANVVRDIEFARQISSGLEQLGGLDKASLVLEGVWRLFWQHSWLLVASAALLLLLARRPRAARLGLLLVPIPLFLVSQGAMLGTAGFAIVWGLAAPYVYAFVPAGRRREATVLLVWIWPPALVGGFMAGYTSASGWTHIPVGLLPALVVSGTLLAMVWDGPGEQASAAASSPEERDAGGSPESGWRRIAGSPLPGFLCLAAIVAVTIVFQFQFIVRAVPYGRLTVRMESGPYWGLKTFPERKLLLERFERTLGETTSPDDRLLVLYQSSGYYLYWRHAVAANTSWLSNDDQSAPLPASAVDYYRRERIAPDVIVRLLKTEGLTPEQIERDYLGGLRGYEVVAWDTDFAILRRKPGVSDAEVIAALPSD